MSDKTLISWAEATWNVVTGCTKVSDGCLNCYIDRTPPFRMAHRRFDPPGIGGTTGVQLHPDRLTVPLHWRKPRRIFVCSLADLFHEDVPDEFIASVFAVMAVTPHHTYQVLTKRHGRMRSLLTSSAWKYRLQVQTHNLLAERIEDYRSGRLPASWTWPLPNVWLGASTEDQKRADIRIPALLMTPAAVHWISAEPLLGPIDLTRVAWAKGGGTHLDVVHGRHGVPDVWTSPAQRLDWVVAGGESGPGARPMHPDWARSLRDQCASAYVPFHFKQHGEYIGTARGGDPWGKGRDPWADREADLYVHADGRAAVDVHKAIGAGGTWHGVWRVGKKAAGRELDGAVHDNYPEVSRG